MSFEKFISLKSNIVPLIIDNIDTDQIIPARFLKSIKREGFGKNLFRDWRYDKENRPIKDFILNFSDITGEVLVVGKNFGCGSSREHAAWAIYDYGFRVVISSSFADIFKNNALNIGLLVIEVSEDFIDKLMELYAVNKALQVSIDIPKQTVEILETDMREEFQISKYKKECLLNGYDDIDYLVSMKTKIERFEESIKQ